MNENTDILQLMQEYSQGKIDLQQVDWDTQFDNLLHMCDLIKTPSPTDRDIDTRVYALYGLTEEEIKVIEG